MLLIKQSIFLQPKPKQAPLYEFKAEVNRQIKHAHKWKLDKTVTIRELTVIAKTELSSDFEHKC